MPRVEFYRRADDLWDWRLFASNGEELCNSDQGYTSEANARVGFDATCVAVSELLGLID